MNQKNKGNKIVRGNTEAFKPSAKELMFKYLAYLPVFIFFFVALFSTAYLYIRYTNPVYLSSISLLIKDDKSNRAGYGGEEMLLESLVQYRKRANLINEIEVLKTTSLMSRVVDNLNLNVYYMTEGKVKEAEQYGKYNPLNARFYYIKDSSQNATITLQKHFDKIKVFLGKKEHILSSGSILRTNKYVVKLNYVDTLLIPGYTYKIIWSHPNKTAAKLASLLKIKQLNREASIINIALQTENPEKGRNILDELVTEYNLQNIDDKNLIVDNTIKFIDERLNLLASELGKVEGGLKDFREERNVIDLPRQSEMNVSRLGDIKEKIDQQEIRGSIIEMIDEYVSNPERRYSLVPSSLGIEDLTLVGLVTEYNEVQIKRETELKTIPAAHPAIRVLDAQLEGLRSKIVENLENIRKASQSVKRKLDYEYSVIAGELQNIPGIQKSLLEITRQQGIKEKLFLFLLQKREDAAITRASAIGGSKPLDPAASSIRPVSPDPMRTYSIAFIFGIVLPLLIVFLRDIFNDKISTKNDILRAVDVPIVGEVSHHQGKSRQFVVGMKDRSMLAEQFRSVRTNLQFIHNASKSSILITSSMSGEGKTFCSINIGAVWALAGRKTVILELDLRKPKITESLQLSSEKGISNYVVGAVEKEELPIGIDKISNLYIIPAGAIPPNPTEILMNRKMDELMEYLHEEFDFIIMDTAPVGLVSDAKILARFADATIYVVRQRCTFKKQLVSVQDLYQSEVLPGMCLLVNDVKLKGTAAYYGYGYTYGYGSTYGTEDQSKPLMKKARKLFKV